MKNFYYWVHNRVALLRAGYTLKEIRRANRLAKEENQ